ncbi:MAG: DUF481 domain-containing protein [Thermoanaerobaculia bacterium]
MLCILGALCLLQAPLLAQRTDVVVLDNGDHITGEVKELKQGRLKFKTDSLGTVYIEWNHIASISSKQYLEIALETGKKFYGTPGQTEEAGKLQLTMYVQGVEGGAQLDMPEIVSITPIKQGFWQRLDGSLDVGVTASESNDLRQYSIGLATSYRTEKYLRTLRVDSLFSSQTGAEDVNRHSASFAWTRFLKKKRFVTAFGQSQQNDELDLELRLMVGVTGGRLLFHTNRTLLGLSGGLALTDEEYSDGTGFDSSVEGILALRYQYFTFDTPKTNVNVDFWVFPSLTISGRYRIEFNASLRRELVKDFFLDLSLLDSFDSDPPTGTEVSNDWTVITSIGYSW